MTTTSPTANKPDDYEAGEFLIREELGLRTILLPTTVGNVKGTHPDQTPCPSWCWIGQQDEYDHGFETTNPMRAEHTVDVRLPVVLSRYSGWKWGDQVHMATLETSMSQTNQARPTISVGKRVRKVTAGAEGMEFINLVALDVEDAREFAKVLNWLVGLHDDDQALNGADHRERNAFEVGRDFERGQVSEESGTMPS